MKSISNIGDIIAIPFFLLLFIYFYAKKNRSSIENVLLLFALGGFFADIYFTATYLYP